MDVIHEQNRAVIMALDAGLVSVHATYDCQEARAPKPDGVIAGARQCPRALDEAMALLKRIDDIIDGLLSIECIPEKYLEDFEGWEFGTVTDLISAAVRGYYGGGRDE